MLAKLKLIYNINAVNIKNCTKNFSTVLSSPLALFSTVIVFTGDLSDLPNVSFYETGMDPIAMRPFLHEVDSEFVRMALIESIEGTRNGWLELISIPRKPTSYLDIIYNLKSEQKVMVKLNSPDEVGLKLLIDNNILTLAEVKDAQETRESRTEEDDPINEARRIIIAAAGGGDSDDSNSWTHWLLYMGIVLVGVALLGLGARSVIPSVK